MTTNAITDLTEAHDRLHQTYLAKEQAINARAAAMEGLVNKTLSDWDGTFNNKIPLAPNLIKNALMDDVDPTTNRPVGFGSAGVMIEAVHPFTKAFEGPYAPDKPTNAVDDPELATATAPYWFSTHDMGPRIGRGGLSDGWGGTFRGHILKITGSAGTGHRLVNFPAARHVQHQVIGFCGYLKLVKGSALCFGTDAGYNATMTGKVINKAEIDAGPQGWLYVDFTVGVSRTMHSTHGTNLGFKDTEDIEAYLALPYMYAPHHASHGFSE